MSTPSPSPTRGFMPRASASERKTMTPLWSIQVKSASRYLFNAALSPFSKAAIKALSAVETGSSAARVCQPADAARMPSTTAPLVKQLIWYSPWKDIDFSTILHQRSTEVPLVNRLDERSPYNRDLSTMTKVQI